MKFDVILRISAKVFLPLILLFAVYVQLHGEYGPGGGFQAGVIVAAGVILYTLIFGLPALRQIVAPRVLYMMIPAGVMIYATVGVACLILGGRYLEYGVLAHNTVHAQEWGVILVEWGVLVSVTGTLSSIFIAFVERRRPWRS